MSHASRYDDDVNEGPSSPIRDGWTGREIRQPDAGPSSPGTRRDGMNRIVRAQSSGGRSAGTETWMDFLRAGPAGSFDEEAEGPADAPMVDGPSWGGRKRHLSDVQDPRSTAGSSASASTWAPRRAISARQPTGKRPSRQLPTRHMSEGQGASTQTAIDLTSPPRAVVRRTEDTTNDRRAQEMLLPRWQPDEEVTNCPICWRKFSFWNRKHHCRKCGRVVCAMCSPHRITIPRQFIVRPPLSKLTSEASADEPPNAPPSDTVVPLALERSLTPVTDLAHEPEQASSQNSPTTAAVRSLDGSLDPLDPSLGGGEEVRICNPCVPDPNYGPPPQVPQSNAHHHQPRGSAPTFSSSRPRRHVYSNSLSAQDQYMGLGAGGVLPARDPDYDGFRLLADSIRERHHQQQRRSAHSDDQPPPYASHGLSGRPQYNRRSLIDPPLPHPSRDSSYAWSTDSPSNSAPSSSGYPHFPPSLQSGLGVSSYDHPLPPLPHQRRPARPGHGHHHTVSASQSSQMTPGRYPSLLDVDAPAASRPMAPPPAKRVYKDEDYCPICGQLFPFAGSSPSSPGFPGVEEVTKQREQHVQQCIASHFVTSAPSNEPSHENDGAEGNQPHPSAAVDAAVAATAPLSGATPRNIKRSSRMLTYRATEKDCLAPQPAASSSGSVPTSPPETEPGDSEQTRAECVICFEEFEVGDEMGRMECFCRFHRRCILDWFETKGGVECPVHQRNV